MISIEAKFASAVAEARDSGALWKALDDLAGATIGHRLFTVTVVDVAASVVRRAYSNMPDDYPTSGTKPLRGNTGEWSEIVFNQRRTFVANSIADIAKVFPDHELIASLGCGAVINMPVVLEGELVGTVNLLDADGRYPAEQGAAADAALKVPAMLCLALARKFDAAGRKPD